MTITVALYGYYEDSTNKDGETGLTVTIDVWRRTKSDGTIAETVTGGSATEIGDGLYYYNIASADPTLYDYLGVFKTASSDVTSKHVAAIRWDAAEGWATGLAALTTGVSLADGAITAAKIASDAITAAKIATDAITSDELAATATAEIAAAIWAYVTRTLTQSAASVTSTVSGDKLTITRGDSLSATFTGLSSNSGYTSLWFTVKRDPADTDASAIIQIKKNASGTGDGLLYLNGAAGTGALGSITVNSATSLTIALDETAADDLSPEDGVYYDIQMLVSGAVTTITSGVCDIVADVTRAVA